MERMVTDFKLSVLIHLISVIRVLLNQRTLFANEGARRYRVSEAV